MSITPAVISLKSQTPTENVIRIDSYDSEAASHNLWRAVSSDGVDIRPNGEMIAEGIDPEQDYTDTNHDSGETNYYQLESLPSPPMEPETSDYISRVEADNGQVVDTEAVDSDYAFLKSVNLLGNVQFGIAPYAGVIFRDENGDLFIPKAYDLKPSDFEDAEESNTDEQYAYDDSINKFLMNSDTFGQNLPVPAIQPDSFYIRFWHKCDYPTSTANPNQELTGLQDGSDRGCRFRLDSDRPRIDDINFTDGDYGFRFGDPVNQGWSLHEIWYDHNNEEFGWYVSQATYESDFTHNHQRSAGALVDWAQDGQRGFRNVTPRGTGNVDFPAQQGSYFVLDTVPSAQEREAWYDHDKELYGY